MGREKQVTMSFMQKLLRDQTANTLAIAAAALLPLMAMVGGGIDASRYYMAAARMQAACDAGALAARRAMTTSTFTSAHQTIGLNFFDQNFHNGIFGVTNRVRNYTSTNGVVTGTASATLPSTIMGAFGYQSFPLSVSCKAEVNISNTDIMFVLDVTGSMSACPNGSECNSGPSSKIVALRSAVVSFYDTVQAATSPSAQVRYGLVPYSQQANVGFSIPRQYLADNHRYQSRVPRFREDITVIPGNGVKVGDTIVISNQVEPIPRDLANLGSTTQSHYYYNNNIAWWGGATTNSADRDLCQITNARTRTVGAETWTITNNSYQLGLYPSAPSTQRAGCRGTIRKTRVATQADVIPDQTVRNIVFNGWRYCEVVTGIANPCGVTNPAGSPAGWESVNFASIYNTRSINLPLGTSGAMTSVSWPGCVEEPDTVSTDNYSPIPTGAHDLNINLVPAAENQKWRPALNTAQYLRYANDAWTRNNVDTTDSGFPRPSFVCPPAARKLSAITRTELQTYVNGLTPSGQTYHDIGMVWGARFISPRGIFAAENTTAPNGDPIARHIVFMTDGAQVNDNFNYSSHGVEWWDRRITGDGNGTREFNRRASRLQAICRAAQQENITVWVVAFGTTLTQNLIDCASPGRAFQASDSTTLNARFQEIAQKIAALRLTQ
jgi:Flp pilus assembly protein TadG